MPDFARQQIDTMYGPQQNWLLPYTPYDRGPMKIPPPSGTGEVKGEGGGGGGLLKKGKTAYNLAKYLKGGPTSGGPMQTLGNTKMYLSSVKSALSSGVGTPASWYAGTQAAQMGVNSGTQLALIEGSYGPSAAYGAASGSGMAASGGSAGVAGMSPAGAGLGGGSGAGVAPAAGAIPASYVLGPMTAAATMHYWAPPIMDPINDELDRMARKMFGPHKSYTLPKDQANAYIQNMINLYGAKLGQKTSEGQLLVGPRAKRSDAARRMIWNKGQ